MGRKRAIHPQDEKQFFVTLEYMNGCQKGRQIMQKTNVEYTVGSTFTAALTGELVKIIDVKRNPAWNRPDAFSMMNVL